MKYAPKVYNFWGVFQDSFVGAFRFWNNKFRFC